MTIKVEDNVENVSDTTKMEEDAEKVSKKDDNNDNVIVSPPDIVRESSVVVEKMLQAKLVKEEDRCKGGKASSGLKVKKDRPSQSTAKGIKTEPKERGGKKKPENKKKILAYLGDQLQTLNRTDIKKQELAEVCGYMKTGSHGFSYAYKDLVDEGMIHKGKLTELGISSLPSEVVSFQKPKGNTEMQDHFLKLLRKRCKEGTDEKTKAIFEVLSDGKDHELKEFTNATGYANLKSKGLGYNITCMEKNMKILEKTRPNTWRFTDKCYPDGRPE